MKQSTALTILKTGVRAFLTGEPGAGKTHVINLLTLWLREKGIPYAVTASTGIAATHINGITIHSFCGMGIKETITDQDLKMIEGKSYVVRQILSCQVLIIDEISMLDATVLDNVDRILSHIRKTGLTGEPFGGLQVIFVGDFFQLPPVSKNRTPTFAFNSKSWKAASPVTCYLTEQHRQSDTEFLDILNSIRHGTITEDQKRRLVEEEVKQIPKTRLFTHNEDVDHINQQELDRMEGEEIVFRMKLSGHEFLTDTLKKNCLSPERLALKQGALVMFTRNNFDEGYVNGTIGTVVNFDENERGELYPIVEIKEGHRIHVGLAKWSIGEGAAEKASIKQFPLRLAWAITVHKSQGMSLDSATVDLSRCFEYGQGYVALSRVCSLAGLHIEGGIKKKAFEMHPEVIEKDVEFRKSSDKMEKQYAEELVGQI